jgi:hypothetical protein
MATIRLLIDEDVHLLLSASVDTQNRPVMDT